MGRPALKEVAPPAAVPAKETKAEAAARTKALKHQQAVADLTMQLMGDRPYNRDVLVEESRMYLQAAAANFLSFGKIMVVLKENEGEGFWAFLRERGIDNQTDIRLIHRAIQAATKFCVGVSNDKQQRIAELGKSKMLELVVLDDEEIQELAKGGSIADGLSLDDFDRMSTTELRHALRKTTKKLDDHKDTHTRMLADKDARMNDLEREVRRISKLTPVEKQTAAEELEADILKVLAENVTQVLVDVQRFEKVIMTALEQAPSESAREAVKQAVQYAFQRINEISLKGGIPVDFAAIVQPEWLLNRHKQKSGR